VAEEVDGLAGEEAFVWIYYQAILLQGGENRLQMPPVCRLICAGYQDVVQVDKGDGKAA
jgi:hypothetical protein